MTDRGMESGGGTRDDITVMMRAEPSAPTVYVVDNDAAHSRTVDRALQALGRRVEVCASAAEFLARYDAARPSCLICDPRAGGWDLFDQLRAQSVAPPVIFIAVDTTVAMAVKAIKAGVFDFLEKPLSMTALLVAVEEALAHDLRQREHLVRRIALERRMKTLTARDWDVLNLLTSGKSNKMIAAQLKISERAVEMRRAKLLRKTGANSLAELLELNLLFRLVMQERAEPVSRQLYTLPQRNLRSFSSG